MVSPITAVAPAPGIASSSSSSSSRHPKLDGVLYHFYAKTSALITALRLTHYEGADATLDGSSTSVQQSRQRRTSSESTGGTSAAGALQSTGSGRASLGTGSGRRPSKWFALEIDDQDVFREELRLWRNVSGLIPDWLLDCAPSATPYQGPTFVPPMILDVILDTSLLSSKHVLMIDEADGDGRTRRRVRVDGRSVGQPSRRSSSAGKGRAQDATQPVEEEPLDEQRHSIVLETWRLDFAIHNSVEPVELPALYKRATAHFREMYGTVTDLPAYALHQRLKGAWLNSIDRHKAHLAGGSNDETSQDDVDSANMLKIGVRMAIGAPSEAQEYHTSLREPVGSARNENDVTLASSVTRSITFPAVQSSIGDLNLAVEYRSNVDFFVEDWHVIKSLQEIALDEDYFRPTMAHHLQKRSTQQQGSPSSASTSHTNSIWEKPKSLLSAMSYQRQQQAAQGSPSPSSDVPANPSPEIAPSRSIPGSATATAMTIFGPASSSSGRPVAGLSSLRANPSLAGYSASPTANAYNSAVGSNASSPALSAAIASDAAFLTHARRSSSSTSDRRLRALSTLNTAPGTPSEREIAQSPSVTGRPILTRAAYSAFPRSGSYSPSSPSPLAQQLHAQQNAILGMGGESQSGRLSSSPSFRGAFASSISPSLRSVFQTYTPSQSQTSISSLSRTPPRSLMDGGAHSLQAHTSLGLRGVGVDVSSSSTAQQSADSGASSSRQPTVGPRMIKRYSSNFQYRQNRQGATSTGSDGNGGGVGRSGSGMAEGELYSKSWQARIEQRNLYASRSLNRDEGAHFPTSSPASLRYGSLRERIVQEDDLDDLVRMLESQSSLDRKANSVEQSNLSEVGPLMEAPSAPSHHDVAAMRGAFDEAEGRSPSAALTMPRHISSPAKRAEPMQFSSVLGFPRHSGMNRTQVDEMLNKMQLSMRELSTSISSTGRGSPASGGAATSSSSGAQSQPDHSPSSHVTGRSPALVRSPLSRGTLTAARTSSAMEAIRSADGDRESSQTNMSTNHDEVEPTTTADSRAHMKLLRSADDYERERSSSAGQTGRQRHDDDAEYGEEDEGGLVRDDREDEGRLSQSHPGRTTSRGSLELYSGTPHSYDPLDDEAAGRLEMASDEHCHATDGLGSLLAGTGAGSGAGIPRHGGESRRSAISAPLRVRSPGLRSTSAGPLISTTEDDAAARQRQSDFELARNFTQTVSTRGGAGVSHNGNGNGRSGVMGKTSLSPWRLRGFHHGPGHPHAHAASAHHASYGSSATPPSSSMATATTLDSHHSYRGRHTPLTGHASRGSGRASGGPTSRAASPGSTDE